MDDYGLLVQGLLSNHSFVLSSRFDGLNTERLRVNDQRGGLFRLPSDSLLVTVEMSDDRWQGFLLVKHFRNLFIEAFCERLVGVARVRLGVFFFVNY